MRNIKKSRFTEEKITGLIKQAEAGVPIKELCRKDGLQRSYFSTGGEPITVARTCRMPSAEPSELFTHTALTSAAPAAL
jgi:putative transposase